MASESQVDLLDEPPPDLFASLHDDEPEAVVVLEEPLEPVEPLSIVAGGTMTLRDYQIESVHGIYRELHSHRSTLAVLATGLGKTVIAAEAALLWPETHGRVLFLAHRKELIEQAAEKIGLHIDQDCGIEMASRSEARQGVGFHGRSKVLVGSVQTLCRPNRIKAYRPEEFGLVITDEAHHGTADSYRTIFGWFQQNRQCRFVGITATPDRADEVELGEVFETVAYKMDILDGIEAGWLVPVHQRFVVVEGLDFSAVKTVAGDLNQGQLERVMAGASADELGDDGCDLTPEQLDARQKQERMLHAVADPTIREANGRPGIVFCVTIDHAEKMATVFRRYGVTAEAVTQNTDEDLRADHIAAFKAGRLQFLIGVGVFTEGFDAPNAAVIAVARPTKSRALYTQMIGRATRPDLSSIDGKDTPDERRAGIAASGKPHATVLDFVGNSGRHKLISTADILGSAFPEDLRAEVLERMRLNAEAADIRSELADCQARREEMRRLKAAEETKRKERERERYLEQLKRIEEEDRLRRLRAEAQYRTREVDPFGQRAEYQRGQQEFRGGASEPQIRLLVSLGVEHDTAIKYGSRQASAVIDKLLQLRGGKARITFGKHKGKSLAEAGEGFAWWVENQMQEDERGRRARLLANIELWRLEKRGVTVTPDAESAEVPF